MRPDLKLLTDSNGKYIGYRNSRDLHGDVCDKDEWTVDIIKTRTDRMVKDIMSKSALKKMLDHSGL